MLEDIGSEPGLNKGQKDKWIQVIVREKFPGKNDS